MALSAELIAEGKRIGILGQLAPGRWPRYSMPQSQSSSEKSLSTRFGRCDDRPPSRTFQSFPPVVRDIAVVCPIALPYGEIERELWKANDRIPCEGRAV